MRTGYRQYLAAKLMANLAAGAVAVGSPLLLMLGWFSLGLLMMVVTQWAAGFWWATWPLWRRSWPALL